MITNSKQSRDQVGICVQYENLAALVPNPHNARKHPKPQLQKLAKSISDCGFVNPVIADQNGNVLAGHGRIEAVKLLGWTKIPVIRLSHLTEAQKRALSIADNKIAELAGWNTDDLRVILQEILEFDADFDLTLTGFEMPEIDIVLDVDKGQAGEVPEPGIPPMGPGVSRPGDVWKCGKHRIACGDSLDATAIATLMAGKKAQAVFTDPPYNVQVDGHVCGKGATHHREFAMASGEMSTAEYLAFTDNYMRQACNASAPGAIHFICMDWRHAHTVLEAARPHYELKNICVWVKDNGGMGSLYRSQHELVFVLKCNGGKHRNNVQLGKFGRNRTNVWMYPGANNFGRQGEEGKLAALHPTVKPVALIADAILDCTARNDIVLDLFQGVGSSVMAAERTGRICYGVELDPRYVDIAIRRWQKHTGEHAVHHGSGKLFDDLAEETKNVEAK